MPLEVYGASELDALVYRAVPSLPPQEDHFRSYADEGRVIPTAQYLRLTGVSMYLSEDGLDDARRKYGLPPETAALDLRVDPRITFAVTNARTGHIEVWAPAEVLLSCVVP